ncbi:DUF418 domain-containing protein [Neobacillus jeddahensis]|uniref:DUF418 domain-containing protein n=1 Tax=Neobacillus jeddahensis TaxID=1461580 RepID=UPI00058ACEC8|nr:DUF418 domain-containing protein [Neobacillus jeddahensis]
MVPIELTKRIDLLDYLRGFALLGIILVNILPLLAVTKPEPHSLDEAYWRFLYLFVEGRFYTIFTFLFGIGLYMFITRALAKGKNGYILFLRRLLVLFIFGLIHVKFHPGEALTVYAISGLILLPFYKVHRRINLVFSIAMLITISILSVKIFMVIPLMLLGITAGQYRVFEGIARHLKKVAMFTILMLLLSIIGLSYQYQHAPQIVGTATMAEIQPFFAIGVTIGPIVSAFYVGAFILLVQRPFIQKLLAPLKSYGRMAFTNYVTQTALILLIGRILPVFHPLTSLYLCLAIYVIQLMFSMIWLRFFKFGPLEWLWRALTYWELPPLLNKR